MPLQRSLASRAGLKKICYRYNFLANKGLIRTLCQKKKLKKIPKPPELVNCSSFKWGSNCNLVVLPKMSAAEHGPQQEKQLNVG